MSTFDSFIKFNIRKLFLSGRIDKVYKKIYDLAEELAVHEMKIYQSLTASKLIKKSVNLENPNFEDILLEKVVAYRQKRLQHHINEMKNLLKLREEILKDNRCIANRHMS